VSSHVTPAPIRGDAEDVHPYLAQRGASRLSRRARRPAPGAASLDVRRYSDEDSNDVFVAARI